MNDHGNDQPTVDDHDSGLPEWLTTDELAQRWRQSRQTVYHQRMRGFGPRGVRIGGRVLYRRSDVDRWEREQGQLQQAERAAS